MSILVLFKSLTEINNLKPFSQMKKIILLIVIATALMACEKPNLDLKVSTPSFPFFSNSSSSWFKEGHVRIVGTNKALEGVTVTAYNKNYVEYASTFTDSSGYFKFPNNNFY